MRKSACVCWSVIGLGVSAVAWNPVLAESRKGDSRMEMEVVEVTAHRLPVDLAAEQALIPGGVALVDTELLFRRQVSDLSDMLRFVPGIWSASVSGSDNVFISSRGSNLDATNYDMNGVRLLQDGLSVTAADGSNHNRIVDPLSSRYASVARGANALSYGASTLGGAINFISPTARTLGGQELYLNGGSHGLAQGRVSVGTVFAGDRGDALLTLEGKRLDGYRGHGEQERYGLYANAGWMVSEQLETRLYATYVANDQELPSGLTAAEVKDDPRQAAASAVSGNYQVNVEAWRLANKTVWQIDDTSSFEGGVYWEKQGLFHPIVDKVMVDFDGPGPNPPVEVFSLLIDKDQEDWGAMLRYNLERGDHQWRMGMNYGETRVEGGDYRNDGGRRNGITTRVNNSAESLEVFILDHWNFSPRWTLVAGAQAVHAYRKVKTITVADGAVREPEDDYRSLNPRLGIIYSFSDRLDIFANVSRLYEAPTNFELEDDARGGNRPLKAMRGTVVEAGSRGRRALSDSADWHWDLSLYYSRITDEILSVDDPAAPGTSLSTNVDDTIHAGIELLVGAGFALDGAGKHRLEPLLNVAVNHFRFADDMVYGNNRLPVAPGYSARAELIYRHHAGLYFGPTLDVIDDRYADFNNSYEVDGYTLMGLRGGYEGKGWEMFAELRNLQDRKYIANHSAVNAYTPESAIFSPGEPRSAYVGVRLKF